MKPLYQNIANMLIEDIQSGKFPLKEMMPTEKELCLKYDVSRHTIREALRILSDLKLVNRQPGLGTVVKSTDSQFCFIQSINNLNEILSYSDKTHLTILNKSSIQIDKQTSKIIGAKLDSSWTKISAIRKVTKSNKPICWSDIYVKPEYSDITNELAKNETSNNSMPVFQVIEKKYSLNVQKVKVNIYASTISKKAANFLEVEEGTPGLSVVRSYENKSKQIFEVSVSLHPQNRFTYSFELVKEFNTKTK
tara:strand:- start:9612 stop:10361 length:750 start_codon:yes stop_codon:yes gene_type:complete